MIGGMYFGLGGGTALPYGAIRTVNNPAAMGQFQLGWQGIEERDRYSRRRELHAVL